MTDRCPHCHDDIGHLNNKAYALHVTETCYILQNKREFHKVKDLSYADIDPNAMLDSDGSDY